MAHSMGSAAKPSFQREIEAHAHQLKGADVLKVPIPGAKKICVQSSFIERKAFEEVVGRDVNFKYVGSDDRFRLHVFYRDGRHEQALMGDALVRLDRQGIERACTDTAFIQLKKFDAFVLLKS